MTARTLVLNWLAAGAIAFGLASAHHLDRDAHEAARHSAQGHGWATDSATLQAEARAVAAREHRRELAAQRLCGSEHATPIWIDERSMRCATKRGYITRAVHQVQP